ncbi:lytic transglycosylase domain-containing protein [Bradyrhizobium sp.]|uniref:lytic transglycosylase domain-containing protein n=1 Tax=Bradyrhizobium sp. TaxID=376 RepID=UPI0026318B37|nr:lytic transglycosylase domain-containing protein [Bradyrhizobium sp.]
MRVAPSKVPSPGGGSRVSGVLLALLLFATLAVSGRSAFAVDDAKSAQQAPASDNTGNEQNHGAKQTSEPEQNEGSAAPPKTPNLCDALGTAAAANELPVDFFIRLIWQESRFKPDAVSRKGAEGIAQFMPATARASGLENPFDPLEAITKSGQLLRDLRQEFGNLGLAAAAYNAGSGRVHDWLGGRRSLPQETRAYVRIVTGRSADEWASGAETKSAALPPVQVPCDLPATALISPSPAESEPKAEPIKPWGVEVVGGTTRANALVRYREWWEPKFAAIVAGREPQVVIRGIIGQSGAARVRIGDDTRAGAQKLCASLKAAGAYCDVMRN